MIAWLPIVGVLFLTVILGVVGGLGFFLQMLICTWVKSPRKRVIPLAVVGGALLVCGLLWLFGIPTTCFVTGPGHLAVYDHILLAILLAPAFVGMEAAWILDRQEHKQMEAPLYGKGVWFAILTIVLGWGASMLAKGLLNLPLELVPGFDLPVQFWFSVFTGAVLLVNTLYRWAKFKTAPNFRALAADIGFGTGILLLEGTVVLLLPQTRYAEFNLQTALSTTAAVGMTLAAVIRFVLNQDDRPGVYGMLKLLIRGLLYTAAGAALLWSVWYQIMCDDNKAFLMTLAFFGPVVLGILMGYLFLLRANGSLEFTGPKEQNTTHGLLPAALLILCVLSGSIQFANMEYRHETRCEMTEWNVHLREHGALEDAVWVDLQAIDQASGVYEVLRERNKDNSLDMILCGYWKPFDWPWRTKIGTIAVTLDDDIQKVYINGSYYYHAATPILQYDSETDSWIEAPW
ncbi:MAG: hypothetical protein IKC09_02520 [Oscillospiraceae bacterium]|nr:hypothetical protein [Oscillospiraceae bacterium]